MDKEYSNTYWASNGKYQEWYSELREKVPMQGQAPTTHIEWVRVWGRVCYDLYNNGLACNWHVYEDEVAWMIKHQYTLHTTAQLEGVDLHALLRTFNMISSNAHRYSEEDTWHDHGDEWWDRQWQQASEAWEKVGNVVIRWAWHEQHGKVEAWPSTD